VNSLRRKPPYFNAASFGDTLDNPNGHGGHVFPF
jgi:hypothetical protein